MRGSIRASAMPEPGAEGRSLLRELAGFARRNTLSAVGGVVGFLIIAMALTAPWIAPLDPLKTDFRRMSKPPDAQSLFGTDQVGRDTLSRVMYGARTSLFVAFSAVLLATTHLGVAIVIEAALGFLGVGVPPPTSTWGNMLADAITALIPQWWLVLFPGLAITVTVLAFNLLGDGIRDTLDPRLSPAVLRLVTGAGRPAPAREAASA